MHPADHTDDAPAVLLVIDDNATNRYILSSWLQRAGHTVIEAADGTQGLALLEQAREERPELAVIDVRLPDMSGFDVCERIKADPRTTGMPVIHVSATAVATDDRTQGLYRGADAYLTEPIAPSELLATVTAALRYSRARSRAVRLAERLTTLNEVTLEVYAAADADTLAAAVARGAASLAGSNAAVLTQSPQTGTTRLTHCGSDRVISSHPATAGLLAQLSARTLGRHVGVRTAQLTAPEWAGLLARTTDGVPPAANPLTGDVVLVAARTKRGRPAVCIVLDAAPATTGEDRKLLTQFAQAGALALEALRSYTEEHTLAVTLQRAFLPKGLPRPAAVELAVRYIPATSQNEIGGDFYEAVETPAGLLLAVGDVAGHCLEAAVVMGELRHALRAYAIDGHHQQALLERLDTLLVRERPGWTATVCLVLIAPDARSVRIANAGHLPPLLIDPDGSSRYVRQHGPLLGLNLAQPPSSRHDVRTGSRILLTTDGLIKTRTADLAARLQELRVTATAGPAHPEALCETLLDAFGPGQEEDIEDDIVLFAARIAPHQETGGDVAP